MKEYTIRDNDAGQRLDRFVGKAVPLLPESLLQKYIRLKRIKLNGKGAKRDTRLNAGDTVQLYVNDEFFEKPREENSWLKVGTPRLNIVYEEENILLLDKKPGLLCHPDDHYYFDSLLARLTRYLYEKGEYDPKDEQSFAPALANRIDRNTGGIVIAAKNAEALRILNLKIRNRELQKLYLCVVHGRLPKKEALLEGFLEKNEDQNRVYISDVPREGALTIRTKYRVLEERGGDSLLEVDLLTGRTHQIRAHLAHIGHPIAGDGKYGKNAQNRGGGYPYQALCSYKLTFRFETDAGLLDYLNGRSFEVPDVWFLPVFYGRKKE